MIDPGYWFLLPTGTLVASVALSSGISASNFWIPIYLGWLDLDPRVAFWSALATMLFGFGSGTIRNLLDRQISGQLWLSVARWLLPATALGALVSGLLPVKWLLVGFAAFAAGQGLALLCKPAALSERSADQASQLDTAGRESSRPLSTLARWVAAGLMQGTIATGSGTVLLPSLLSQPKIGHHARAVGTTTALVLASSLVAVIFRLDAAMLATLDEETATIASVVVFAGSGAAIGGQVGPRMSRLMPRALLRPYVGVLLLSVAALVGARIGGLG